MKTESLEQFIPAGTWATDAVDSSVQFTVKHNLMGSFRSGFGAVAAVLVGGHQPRLEGAVEVASIDIDDAQLKGHLLSPDFFDAERYPELRFSSTELVIGDGGAVRITGDLEIRGEHRLVSATGKLAGEGRLNLTLEAAVDRRDFKMGFQMQLPKGGDALEYEVRILAELTFSPKAD